MLVRLRIVEIQGIEILEHAGDGDVKLEENVGDVFEVFRRWVVFCGSSYCGIL